MPSVRTLKNKIRFTKNVQKITRAVEAISAIKLRENEKKLKASNEYLFSLESVATPDYYVSNNAPDTCIIIIAPDKGFCGHLLLKLRKKLEQLPNPAKTYTVSVFRNGLKLAKKSGLRLFYHFPLTSQDLDFESIFPIFKIVNDYFLKNAFGEVLILYSKYNNFFDQEAVIERFLPIDSKKKEERQTLKEPFPESFARNSSELLLKAKLLNCVLHAVTSENAVRLMSMRKASDNAKEVMRQTIIGYNKKRQALITTEILSSGN